MSLTIDNFNRILNNLSYIGETDREHVKIGKNLQLGQIPVLISRKSGLSWFISLFYKPKNERFSEVAAFLAKFLRDNEQHICNTDNLFDRVKILLALQTKFKADQTLNAFLNVLSFKVQEAINNEKEITIAKLGQQLDESNQKLAKAEEMSGVLQQTQQELAETQLALDAIQLEVARLSGNKITVVK